MATTSIQYPTVLEGILSRPGMPSPLLLDAIRYAETGHLSPDKANKATSGKGAIGAYQLMQNNLHDMGYGVRPNITVQEARDPIKARQIAYDYISGYNKHHNFDSIYDTLVAYNWGASNAARWKAAGSKWEDLPLETQQYVRRASQYIYNNPEQFNNAGSMMGNFSQMQQQPQAQGSNSMAQSNFNPSYMGSRMGMVYPNATNTQPNPNAVVYPNATNTPPNPNAIVPLNQAIQSSPSNPLDPSLLAAMQYERQMGDVQPDPSLDMFSPPYGNALYAYDYKNTGDDYESLNDPNSAFGVDPNPLLQDDPGNRFNTPAAPSQYNQQGVLTTKIENVPTTQGGALTTGNRFKTPLSPSMPKAMDINEMLIRIGSAGLSQAQNGSLAMMAAAGAEYGNLKNMQRSNALEAYTKSLSAKPDGKDDEEAREQIAQLDQTLFDMKKAVGLLEQGGLTGFFQGTIGSGWDSVMGNPEAGSRLLLKKLRVDAALLNVAQTKGAISNAEMKLFLSPTPSMWQSEQVWIDWINDRMQAAQNVRNRLAQGLKVNPDEAATVNQVQQFGSAIGTPVTLANGATVTKLD